MSGGRNCETWLQVCVQEKVYMKYWTNIALLHFY